MTTLLFQSLTSVLMLLFGIGAWRVARRLAHSPDVQRSAWLLTGLGFTLLGGNVVLHNAFAVWAFVAGPGTTVYSKFLEWSPVGNSSRNFLVLLYGAVLLLLPTLWRLFQTRLQALAVSGFLAAMVVGGVVGWLGWPFIDEQVSEDAFLNSLILLVLLVALFRSLFTHSMDRLLWLCVGIFAIHEALNVIWLSRLAWFGVPGAWVPSFAQFQMYAAAAYLAMIAVAAHRWILARRGVRVPTLLEPLPERRFSTFG